MPEEQIERFAPDTWMLDWALMSRPANVDLQLDLFGDYRRNVATYPAFHEFFRSSHPLTLVVWGRHDLFFTVVGHRPIRATSPTPSFIFSMRSLRWFESREDGAGSPRSVFARSRKPRQRIPCHLHLGDLGIQRGDALPRKLTGAGSIIDRIQGDQLSNLL
jgi:hypothetical protein